MASTHGSSSAACLWATGTSWHRKSEMLGIHMKIPSSGCWLVTVLCRSISSTHFPQLRTTQRSHLASSILLWNRARACLILKDFCLSLYSCLTFSSFLFCTSHSLPISLKNISFFFFQILFIFIRYAFFKVHHRWKCFLQNRKVLQNDK